jgi:hypothetical protein
LSDPVDAAIDRATAAGAALRAASDEHVLRSVARVIAGLHDRTSALGREAHEVIVDRAGLSREGGARALDATLEALDEAALTDALHAMRRSFGDYRATPVRGQAIVLASSVFTACLRPIVWSLLARVPVVVKVSRLDEGLAELFAVALAAIGPEFGESVAVVRAPNDTEALYARLAARVDVVSAHGGDHAIARMRAATPATTEFVAHGHGLGVIVVTREALAAHLRELASAIAHDVATYDQRGCLSPQVIFVERGGDVAPRDLASLIASEGLSTLARAMPRGALPVEVGAQQVQWRGLASSLHELFEGYGYATSFETGPVRPTPGYRNIAVHAFESPDDLAARLAPYGAYLKVVALAGDGARIAWPPPLAPRICAPGQMQRPSLLAATDGLPPWHGLHRLA